jgi:hypothetical protein
MSLRSHVVQRVRATPWLHRAAMRTYSVVHPPPYRRPNMEFECDPWNGISSLHYKGQRQLGEDNAGPYPYGESTGNRYEICRFGDTRLGLPMNVTNLRLVMPYAAEAYGLTTALRQRYITHRGLTGPRFSLVQAYLYSKLSATLPAFLTRRADRPIRDGEIEPLETAFYMLGSAPFILMRQLIARGDRRALEPEPMSGDALYALSCEGRALISTRERACPATPKLIREFFDVIMNGRFDGPLDSPAIARVFERIGDWQRLYDYTLAASRLELLLMLNRVLTLHTLRQVQGVAYPLGADVEADVRDGLISALALSDGDAAVGSLSAPTLELMLATSLTLLDDHGETQTLTALADEGLLPAPAAAPLAPEDLARRIRAISDQVLHGCQRELAAVHAALGTRSSPPLGIHDVLRRCGGPDMETRLWQLEIGGAYR